MGQRILRLGLAAWAVVLPLAAAPAEHPWSAALGAGSGSDLYRPGWLADLAYQVQNGRIVDGQVRLVGFGLGASSKVDAFGTRLGARASGWAIGYDWLFHFGPKASAGPYAILGAAVGSNRYQYTYTSALTGTGTAAATQGSSQTATAFHGFLGLGLRLTARASLELRLDGILTSNAIGNALQAGWSDRPDPGTNLVTLGFRWKL